jgi:integrase
VFKMAVIRNRGDYQFQAIVRRRGYEEQSKTFNTKKEAQSWAVNIESEMVRGVFVSRVEAERTMLCEVIERYILEVCPKHKGCYSETLRLRALARHPLGRRFMATLKPLDFARYRDDRLKIRMPATVQRELALFSAVIEVGRREWGLHIENPISMISKPSVRNARSRRLSPEEEILLMAELDKETREPNGQLAAGGVRNIWIKPLVLLALETAMRRGELLSLRWENVDLAKQVAFLPDTKNGDSRSVPLSTAAVRLLQGLPRSIDGRVFATSADAVKKAFSRAVVRAGLVDFHFHDTRHEATTRLARRLPNIIELAKLTGHRDVNTLKIYYIISAQELALKLG